MKKLANMPMDIVDEILQEDVQSLLQLIKDIPEEVKTAHIPTTEDLVEMDENNFALVLFHPDTGFQKKFANYNKDLTIINSVLFNKKSSEFPDELCKIAGANLYAACVQFKIEIPKELEKYASDKFVNNVLDLTTVNKRNYAKKLENVEPEYKVEKLAFALPIHEKFPIHDEFHKNKAVEYFEKNSHTLDIMSRVEYAKNINNVYDKASNKIKKYASFNVNKYNDEVEIHVKTRKRFLKEADHKYVDGLLNKLAEFSPLQTCMYLEEIDNTFNLSHLYGKQMDDAPSSCFEQVKEASVLSHNGTEITKRIINNIVNNEKFAELFDNELLANLKSDDALNIFSKLSENSQNKLLNLL